MELSIKYIYFDIKLMIILFLNFDANMEHIIQTVRYFQKGVDELKNSNLFDFYIHSELEDAEVDLLTLESVLLNFGGDKYSPFIKSSIIIGLGGFRNVLFQISSIDVNADIKKLAMSYLKKLTLTILIIKNNEY